MDEQRWPRHYASEIAALPSADARRAALRAVPEAYRAWVERYVRDIFDKRSRERREGKREADSRGIRANERAGNRE